VTGAGLTCADGCADRQFALRSSGNLLWANEAARTWYLYSLKSFGVKLHKVGRGGFEQAVRNACAEDGLTTELTDCMLTARSMLWRQYLSYTTWWSSWWRATSCAGA
jgi:hypothetical protein